MKYFIIGICVLIIVYAVVILIKTIIRMSKGKCCEGCSNCPTKHMCSVADKEKNKLKNADQEVKEETKENEKQE
ncbi:MAG: hypothetical protein RSD67_06945 [Oscillospiraceae bacterium]